MKIIIIEHEFDTTNQSQHHTSSTHPIRLQCPGHMEGEVWHTCPSGPHMPPSEQRSRDL